MPWVLSNGTSTIFYVVWLVVACWNNWFVAYRLLDVDFLGNIFWYHEDACARVCGGVHYF